MQLPVWYHEPMKHEQQSCGIVVAYDRNHSIGADGDMPWGRALPADLRHFRDLTTGSAVIMGRKTYESIGRPLPNRQNIVLTSGDQSAGDVTLARSLAEALQLAERRAFIIGGGAVYAAALQAGIVDRIYATEVQAEFPNADTFFPELDMNQWQEVSRQHHPRDEKNLYPYDFVVYSKTSRSAQRT